MNNLYLELGLKDFEYEKIKKDLNREPNELEMYMYSAQWSEHCGYKHSKELLKKLPKNIENENAGYVLIDDYAVVFKVESHNHPSAVEPYQGAATGIGGIVRDVLAMGARPVALLDSLRFGIDTKSKNIFEGVVSGISGYGNSIGVPTIAGETFFDEFYNTNPLVNVMCVGLVKKDELASSRAKESEKLYVYVGSKTGRDGIHGASFASKKLSGKDDRPSVQVGDPFSEKNLIEATLEILKLKGVLACQDMGAAGILSSSSEMSFKGNLGCELYMDNVPLREENMEVWEILLSESQERMLFLVESGKEKEIKKIAEKYFLDYAVIGKTIKGKNIRIIKDGNVLSEMPISSLVDAPSMYRPTNTPSYIKKIKNKKFESNFDLKSAFYKVLRDINVVNKSWVFEQYDYKVGTNTLIIPGKADASVIWIKNTNKGIAVTIDGNGLYSYIDPYEGSRNIVFEAARNLVAIGAKPLGITDNMNFGNPEDDMVMWQFEKSIDGISNACKILNIPVTGGNVSFYNESEKKAILPTPVIGMVGEVEINKIMDMTFKNVTDKVYLIGKVEIDKEKIGGSVYQRILNNFIGGEIDKVDTNLELRLYEALWYLIENKIINSAHDVSKGGILIAILESALNGEKGFRGNLGNTLEELFGENQSRFILTVPSEKTNLLEGFLKGKSIEFRNIGEVMPYDYGFNFGFDKFHFDELKDIYFNSIQNYMEE
ncbi:phosphoribosylformylglycinamidine synthase subunit II [Marinitoga hydrogenitolerans DSM 16785]|uniref:Phosphoribosylformylglycinamidine synthase subunit PurL n=1 Tax=Marinitoga hydrogenitolerans (strain DSM 16785 / JCM 12826 / AT1271) TaxID=1122195 RepID=A0A1M4YUZ9_MARH1|nr:phosphoribosylformylglycinamidine synthase subunit PurL [Marinitoga hydrogenitolerans]SHF09593.1 phosphoribosylformylglycinamidine synthase subunit II [Marinitoga hydrogenitolerans DSM 16785]